MELSRKKLASGWKVELVHDQRSVARLWIVDRIMRVGDQRVRVGGIAGVGTDRAYRKRGLASQVLGNALELMRDEGYDLSFLFGIQDFYHRFGFATCMAERRFSLDTRDAERVKGAPSMRLFRPGAKGGSEIRQIRQMYNRLNRVRTASIVRERGWNCFPMASGFGVDPKVYVWDQGAGRIGAYAVCDARADRCRAAEVGAESSAGMAAIIRLLARRAVSLRRERIQVCMPIDSEFAIHCRGLGLVDETRYERNAGPMARIINLQSTMTKLQPLWAQRWQRGERLDLQTDIGKLRLERKKNGVVCSEAGSGRGARAGQDGLVQALLGYRSVEDLKRAGALKANRAQEDMLSQLFPLQESHMSWPDRF